MRSTWRARFGIVGLAPLRSPAFRRYLLAATLVNVCLWTYQTGLSWTLLSKTGSAATVSLIQTLMTVPLPLAMLPAGLLTDRFGSRPMMTIAYAGYAGCVGLTGLLAVGDNLPIAGALGLAFALGIFDALNVVSAPIFVGRSVPPAEMGAAIGLAILSNGFGRIAGGPLGGLLVGAFGASGALLPAAGVLLIALLVVTRLPQVSAGQSAVRWRYADLTAAFMWARQMPLARLLVLMGATMALFVSGYVVLLPSVTRDLVGGGASELGLLTAAGGVGLIVAAFFIDAVGRRVGRVRIGILGLLGAGLLLAVVGSSRAFAATALIVGLLAACSATFSATTNLLLQLSAPSALRGRAVALYGLVFYGLQPIGIVSVGILADRLGVGEVLVGMAGATVIAVLIVVLANRAVWPVILGRGGTEFEPAALEAAAAAPTGPAVEVSSEPAAGA